MNTSDWAQDQRRYIAQRREEIGAQSAKLAQELVTLAEADEALAKLVEPEILPALPSATAIAASQANGSRRSRAAERGTASHDILRVLALNGPLTFDQIVQATKRRGPAVRTVLRTQADKLVRTEFGGVVRYDVKEREPAK